MANTLISVRSPYLLSVTGTAGQSIRTDLYFWNSPDSIPATPQKVLSKPIPSSNQTTVYFDISEYARKYITHLNYSEVIAVTAGNVSEYCFCTAKTYKDAVLQTTYTFICLDGYTYHEEGYNKIQSDALLTSGSYQIKEDENSGGFYVHDNGTDTYVVTYYPLGGGFPTYSPATIGDISYFPYIHENFKGTGGNKVIITKNAVAIGTYYFNEICEPKYTPIECDFVNKFGVWQRVIFFKVSMSSFEMSNNEFKLMPSTPNYSIYENRNQSFNTNGNIKIKCNTGIVDEEYSEVMKQLYLSEKILLDNQPVKISSKGLDLMEHINKKIINYEVTFEYSNMAINNVQ